MNGAPDWQDGECCFRCRTQFTLVARKHHCRNCGNIFCAKCSSQQIPLPKLSIEKNVRVCDGCFEKLSKEEDSLALALDNNNKSSDVDTNKTKSTSAKSANGSTKSSNKLTASASAPSEQELKEEEELQLALALSLSEAPAKVRFPDCKQFEDGPATSATSSASVIGQSSSSASYSTSNNIPTTQADNNIKSMSTTGAQPINYPTPEPTQYVSTPDSQQNQQTPNISTIANQYPPQDYAVLDTNQELFRFVAEVQSTSEVFLNRVNSSKLRNRPIANDSAIQGLFMKLTNMHTKLLEYIAKHEEERASFESLQDKLSQIMDSRAALDALREEHREKMRLEAAEAERQRQNQLALKLEVMRQKKSQMMQYQREVALQRIQAQEKSQMMQYQGEVPRTQPQEVVMRPPQNNFQSFPTTVPQQTLPQLQQQPQPQPQPQQLYSIQNPPQHQLPQQQTLQQPMSSHGLQQQQQQLQQPPQPPPEDEAPLISFDD